MLCLAQPFWEVRMGQLDLESLLPPYRVVELGANREAAAQPCEEARVGRVEMS